MSGICAHSTTCAQLSPDGLHAHQNAKSSAGSLVLDAPHSRDPSYDRPREFIPRRAFVPTAWESDDMEARYIADGQGFAAGEEVYTDAPSTDGIKGRRVLDALLG